MVVRCGWFGDSKGDSEGDCVAKLWIKSVDEGGLGPSELFEAHGRARRRQKAMPTDRGVGYEVCVEWDLVNRNKGARLHHAVEGAVVGQRAVDASGIVIQADARVEAQREEERVLALVADVDRGEVSSEPVDRIVDLLTKRGLLALLDLCAPRHAQPMECGWLAGRLCDGHETRSADILLSLACDRVGRERTGAVLAWAGGGRRSRSTRTLCCSGDSAMYPAMASPLLAVCARSRSREGRSYGTRCTTC